MFEHMYEENAAHIVYASDDRFAEIMGVSMVSLFDNNTDFDDIVVYILDSGISFENKKKIEDTCERFGRSKPVWIYAKNISEELGIHVEIDRGSLSQFSRLFVSRDLPSELKRVLYLDCDIIVNKSIKELWNLDLQGKTIGALMDAFSKYYRKNIGLQPNDIMFNSGVMLIDLARWRETKIEEKLLAFIKQNKGKVQQGDQGALNAVLSHETYCFSPCFNTVTIFFDFSYAEMLTYRKPPEFYCEEEVKKAVEDPVIIHFTTSFLSERAWVKGCNHRYVDRWLQYKSMSPWRENPLWEDKQNFWKCQCFRLYEALPDKLAMGIASFLQVYGRPLINRLRIL